MGVFVELTVDDVRFVTYQVVAYTLLLPGCSGLSVIGQTPWQLVELIMVRGVP